MRELDLLSDQQKKVLDFILHHHLLMGRNASFTEISRHIGTGYTRAQQHVERLAGHGWLAIDLNRAARSRKAHLTDAGYIVMAKKFVERERLPEVLSDTERELEFKTVDIIEQAFKDGNSVCREDHKIVVMAEPPIRYDLGPIDPS